MTGKRHKGDSESYRSLDTYKERMQSFNASTMKLREYARVMLDVDITSRRDAAHIVDKTIRRLEKEIHAIRQLKR